MPTYLNKKAYQKLINEDIIAIEKCFPENSLEKEHIKKVLQWSVFQLYDKEILKERID